MQQAGLQAVVQYAKGFAESLCEPAFACGHDIAFFVNVNVIFLLRPATDEELLDGSIAVPVVRTEEAAQLKWMDIEDITMEPDWLIRPHWKRSIRRAVYGSPIAFHQY